MWRYEQSTGRLTSPDGKWYVTGYSGAGAGKNNPAKDDVPNVGPIPRGRWAMVSLHRTTKTHGPEVIVLEALPGTVTHNRSGFLVHGDSVKDPGNASQGCIILPRSAREELWKSDDHVIEVVK